MILDDLKLTRARERRKNDEGYAISGRLRSRLRRALKGMGDKSEQSLELFGESGNGIINFLQLKNPELNGTRLDKKCHVDHHIPCANFDLSRQDHQLVCFHYTNLRLLPGPENSEEIRCSVPEDFNFDEWFDERLKFITKIKEENINYRVVFELYMTKLN